MLNIVKRMKNIDSMECDRDSSGYPFAFFVDGLGKCESGKNGSLYIVC
ncbi:hypothetical protein B0I22_1507 [Epilithonimonas xixisoli]|uniref:Uncharacterized protein n=1 Tax=Epilithonimonas xixisoli TaxID=1476462 RepID=A0A4R8I5S7_9FLAO|nr:hypothetical protein B0I22_1507 [Epilithonimonas xixisoli]